jgi:hypothetical protein
MCYDYEFEYLARRAEEARKELKKTQEKKEPQPAAPVEVPEEKPVPA